MNDLKVRTGVNPSSADSTQLLQVITALNLVRMNLGMYPPGHSRITESIDNASDIIQKILLAKTELLIGFSGDSLMFGETAPDKEKKNAAFRDYARCLNNLRIVSFTLRRGVKKEELLEFNRILSAKPADIWALGKIESVFTGAGITGIKVKVIDADHFRLDKKKEIILPRIDKKAKDERFWENMFDLLKSEAIKRSENDGILTDQEKIDPVEAIRFLNKQKEDWPSAVFSYEKMVDKYLSGIPKGRRVGAEEREALAGVNSLVSDLNPELKKQLIDVVERQLTLHPDTPLTEKNLELFPRDIFKEIVRQTNERGSQISPTLINLLKKMSGTQQAPASPDRVKEKDFTSKDMETLLNREEYEKYVPEEYDRLLKKAAEAPSSSEDIDESRFPLREYLKTLAHKHVDFLICQMIHSLIDDEITEEDYLACSDKLAQSIPELLKGEQFSFLTTVIETLRRHALEKTNGNIRQKALSILKSLSDKETIARHVAPSILNGTGDPALLTKFLVESGVQNLSWLFDLYLDPKTPLSATITVIMKGFGKNAAEEALKRLSDQKPDTIIRLLKFIRETGDSSVSSSLSYLFQHEDWAVRRELIKTLIEFDDPAVIELLRKSLKAVDKDEVLEAVGLSCSYRVGDFLEDLTSMIKTVVIREENAILNEWIVGELSKTGNVSVIPCLEKIAATWFSLSPKYLSGMKLVLYRNLRHFPKNQIMKLLKIGNGSGNKEIRAISAKLIKNKE